MALSQLGEVTAAVSKPPWHCWLLSAGVPASVSRIVEFCTNVLYISMCWPCIYSLLNVPYLSCKLLSSNVVFIVHYDFCYPLFIFLYCKLCLSFFFLRIITFYVYILSHKVYSHIIISHSNLICHKFGCCIKLMLSDSQIVNTSFWHFFSSLLYLCKTF